MRQYVRRKRLQSVYIVGGRAVRGGTESTEDMSLPTSANSSRRSTRSPDPIDESKLRSSCCAARRCMPRFHSTTVRQESNLSLQRFNPRAQRTMARQQLIFSPASTVGAGRFDPFLSYPVRVEPYMHRLIKFCKGFLLLLSLILQRLRIFLRHMYGRCVGYCIPCKRGIATTKLDSTSLRIS